MLHQKLCIVPLAVALSLTACGDELSPERVPPESIWVTDRLGSPSTLRTFSYDMLPSSFLRVTADESLVLYVCASHSPNGTFGVDGDSTACIHLTLDEGVLGTGPKKLNIAGQSSYFAAGRTSTFTSADGHSPEIKGAHASVSCAFRDSTSDTTQEVSGRLVLEENSATRLRGYVVATSIGKLLGGCFGNKAEANLSFDIPR